MEAVKTKMRVNIRTPAEEKPRGPARIPRWTPPSSRECRSGAGFRAGPCRWPAPAPRWFPRGEGNSQNGRIGSQLIRGADTVVVHGEQANRTPRGETARDGEFHQGAGLPRARRTHQGGDPADFGSHFQAVFQLLGGFPGSGPRCSRRAWIRTAIMTTPRPRSRC